MPQQTPRVAVSPEMMSWAVRYSRREDYLRGKYPKLDAWIEGTVQPTMKQLESFARDTRVAEGYFYGTRIPEMELDMPDMRTVGGIGIGEPSPELYDTIYACRRRQDWYADYAEWAGQEPLPFVGSLTVDVASREAAAEIRSVLGFGRQERAELTRARYRQALVRLTSDAGLLVMINGVVEHDTSRKLDPGEFRGFAVSHELAPLIFVNGADSLSAQIFTLAHELGHIWLGETALSAPDHSVEPDHPVETWCNAVAAEMLAPLEEIEDVVGDSDALDALPRLGRHFKVSDMVLLRRLRDAGMIASWEFSSRYDREMTRERAARRGETQSGGDFYANLFSRVGRPFAEALYCDTREGNTNYHEAYRLLGLRDGDSFERLGERLGFEF